MPFPKAAKDNLVVALSLANVFTDAQGQYPSLLDLIRVIQGLQRYLAWQVQYPYHLAQPGNNAAQKALFLYLLPKSSVDLYVRYVSFPEVAFQAGIPKLGERNQTDLHNRFCKTLVIQNCLLEPKTPRLKTVKKGLKSAARAVLLGYDREDGHFSSEAEWKDFVNAINLSLEELAGPYKDKLKAFHAGFSDFRQGHLIFIQNYFDRCLFLARLEIWLNQVPTERNHLSVDEAKVNAFCLKLKELEKTHQEQDLREFYSFLDHLKTRTLSQAQQKKLASALFPLKAKYDAYCTGQEKLNEETFIQEFMAAWPKPKLPRLFTPREDKEADQAWRAIRNQYRKQQEAEGQEEGLKHKLSAGRRPLQSAAF